MRKINLHRFAVELYIKLLKLGVKFNEFGYPICPKEMLLTEAPDEIIPFEHKNSCRNPKKTDVCYFQKDKLLYRRLQKLDSDANILQHYMAVSGFDLSPRLQSDLKNQKFNILLNRMIDVYMAIKGIKILPNFRIGDLETIDSLSTYPVGSCFAVGTLGSSNWKVTETDLSYLMAKLLYIRPSKLLIYGKLKNEYKRILDELNVPFRVYEDFRTSCFNK